MVCPVDGFTVDRLAAAAVLITFDIPIYPILEISPGLVKTNVN
jgi:hypothetical protein